MTIIQIHCMNFSRCCNTTYGIVEHPINFLEDDHFHEMRQILDAKMKELSVKGLGSKKRQAEIITEEEENQLWDRNILWENNPEQLIHTIIYLIGLNFALMWAHVT